MSTGRSIWWMGRPPLGQDALAHRGARERQQFLRREAPSERRSTTPIIKGADSKNRSHGPDSATSRSTKRPLREEWTGVLAGSGADQGGGPLQLAMRRHVLEEGAP